MLRKRGCSNKLIIFNLHNNNEYLKVKISFYLNDLWSAL